MVWQLSQPCHGCFWRGISNVRNSRSLNLMTAQKNKQHIKKILLSKTQLEYLSKLAYIVLSHQYTDLGCARQNMSQRCPELTKFLPISKQKIHIPEELLKRIDGLFGRFKRGEPYTCKICPFHSKHRGHMREHVETHLEGPRYPCNLCGKTFR